MEFCKILLVGKELKLRKEITEARNVGQHSSNMLQEYK